MYVHARYSAVSCMKFLTSNGLKSGFACSIRAATPAAPGVAIEVPEKAV